MSFEINLEEIGKRVEQLRGNLSQIEFAAMLGVDRKTIGTWERGEQLPATKALISLWAEFDADPAWVLTGRGFTPSGTDDERELLALFRAAPRTVKAAAFGALQSGSNSQFKFQIGGKVQGQVVEGGMVNNAPIHFGSKNKTKK